MNLYDLPYELICKIFYIKNKEYNKEYKQNHYLMINEIKYLHVIHAYTFFRGRKLLTNINKNIIWFELQII